ncbi:unnamed protein product [Mytilus edulis]|uniref:Uncharacterized protein n=1 Tax=Mytilus edulis TaxID=6550 RepID=A0A8S3UFD7_MYTED|nr:unnamed protein product [Mytilus edulis]
MFKGRKVANPVVQGASNYPKDTDIARAWNNVGKARSELRKIEHRLGDVHSSPVYLNETGNPSVRNYNSLMDNSNSNEFPSGDDENEDFTSASKMEGKRVDFRDKQELREINPDGTYTDLPPGQYNNLTFLRPNSPPNSIQTTLTDSRAIRETEIRFLNEPTSHTPHDQRRVGTENRLTHVDVMVPGAAKSSSAKHTTHYQGTNSNPQENNNEYKTAENDRLWETGSTDSAQSDDGPMKRKFKKSIKDIGEENRPQNQSLGFLSQRIRPLDQSLGFLSQRIRPQVQSLVYLSLREQSSGSKLSVSVSQRISPQVQSLVYLSLRESVLRFKAYCICLSENQSSGSKLSVSVSQRTDLRIKA